MVRALIFDVFGTCVDWHGSIAQAVSQVHPGIDALAFADAWRAEYQPAMARVRDGGRGYVPLEVLHLENLDRISRAFGVPMVAGLNATWEALAPWPDVVPGLTALRSARFIAPCSNGSIAMMVRLARRAGLPWDAVLGADLARDYKPKPAVYTTCCAALRVPPAQVMMVAAHNDDLAAARAAGLQTAFVPRPTEHGPAQSRDLGPTGNWDVIARDFIHLAQQVAHDP